MYLHSFRCRFHSKWINRGKKFAFSLFHLVLWLDVCSSRMLNKQKPLKYLLCIKNILNESEGYAFMMNDTMQCFTFAVVVVVVFCHAGFFLKCWWSAYRCSCLFYWFIKNQSTATGSVVFNEFSEFHVNWCCICCII